MVAHLMQGNLTRLAVDRLLLGPRLLAASMLLLAGLAGCASIGLHPAELTQAPAISSSTTQFSVTGNLVIIDWYSGGPLPCSYGSGTYPSPHAKSVTLSYGGPSRFQPDADITAINWVKCGDAVATNLNITSTSSNHTLVFTAWPTRVLNVLLYPYLPSAPGGNFSWLQALLAIQFQTMHPDTVLNLVLSPDDTYDIYTASNLDRLLGPEGFDVVELDMLLLPYAVTHRLVTPVRLSPGTFWPAAVAAVTYSGTPYAVPSWLCSDFLYSHDPAIQQLTTLSQLLTFLQQQDSQVPRLVGDFNGRWRLIALYLQAYVDLYGYKNVNAAMQLPLDGPTLDAIVAVTGQCASDGSNDCVNGKYHSVGAAAAAGVFATGGADTYVGFSEQSFYILGTEPKSIAPLYAAPLPYGSMLQPMLFVDAFTQNAARCGADTACAADAATFIDFMNRPDTRIGITYAWDLAPIAEPPRHLLPAISAFYEQPLVQHDPLFAQYETLIRAANAFPSTIDSTLKDQLYGAICTGLQQRNPGYKC